MQFKILLNVCLYCAGYPIGVAGQIGARLESPLFRCEAMLSIPYVVMLPTLDDIQQAVNTGVQHILGVFKDVPQWTKVWSSVINMFT